MVSHNNLPRSVLMLQFTPIMRATLWMPAPRPCRDSRDLVAAHAGDHVVALADGDDRAERHDEQFAHVGEQVWTVRHDDHGAALGPQAGDRLGESALALLV